MSLPCPCPALRPQGDRLPDDAAQFLEDLTAFLRKWQLMELATWDLPVPQGPLHNAPSVLARLLGPDQTITAAPAYYDIPSNTDVRGEIHLPGAAPRAGKAAGFDDEHPLTDLVGRPIFD